MAGRGEDLLRIDGNSLRIENVAAVARHGEKVSLSRDSRTRVRASREAVEAIVKHEKMAYGIKTGFGELANVAIPGTDLLKLQLNLIRSHAIGLGDPLSEDEVRAALLVRANALSKGYSGVREELLEMLVELLNRGVHPVIPSRGSLGASGDLAPLAHMALVLVGEGEAHFGGKRMTGREALEAAGLHPLVLQSKEGLALVNGTSVMAGVGSLVVHDAICLLRDAQVAASMSFEALKGSPEPFDPRIASLKPHPGLVRVATNMRRLLVGSEIIPSHPGSHRVQDPYSLRCIPQVLGACADAIENTRRVIEIEINSATDNPLIMSEEKESLSGGNFHGQEVAMALDQLTLAMTIMSGISERRIARLVDARLSDLPPFLTEESGLNSGMMLSQYVAAALVSENKTLSFPASADSIPTSANQEDYVPMGQWAALKSRHVLENARMVIAIEYLCSAQGLDFREPALPGKGPRAAHTIIRTVVPHLDSDRAQHGDVEVVLGLMREGSIVAAAEKSIGKIG